MCIRGNHRGFHAPPYPSFISSAEMAPFQNRTAQAFRAGAWQPVNSILKLCVWLEGTPGRLSLSRCAGALGFILFSTYDPYHLHELPDR
ncbi:MAG: hypothetical protein JWM59_4589 [Verrucomicrobiales bacterium]|nr:hypothetical protein [Verrucomicrobiales bacterium]